jgi:hypothetical protein
MEKQKKESGDVPDQQAVRTWYKGLLDRVVREMLKSGAVQGAAVEARPVWVYPEQVLIARVWSAAQKSQFIWAIAGEGVVIDHIAGSLAADAREAAKHFSLKWQMDADRLVRTVREKPALGHAVAQIEEYSKKLVAGAEMLYRLTEREDIWKHKLPA